MCYVTNVVKCMPPQGRGFRKPTASEIEACASRWLDEELAQVKPNVVVALGEVAAHRLGMPKEAKITMWRGTVIDA